MNKNMSFGRTEKIVFENEEEQPAINTNKSNESSYKVNTRNYDISFIELAIINNFLFDSFKNSSKETIVSNYGQVDNLGRINFGSAFDETNSYWFDVNFKGDQNNYIIQTRLFIDNRGEFITELFITAKNSMDIMSYRDLLKKLLNQSFNNSEYKGKCIKVKLRDMHFKGIEIIEIDKKENDLILNKTQKKFIDHFIYRLKNGGYARYLLNGEAGTGKTQTIREIIRSLSPNVTFIIPEFSNSEDLISILEACEIFERGVIIMDDIDLFLGSRDNGSYTRLLGEFLSFFDGVKKRKVSLLASTNDKGLVDKAAERPGRFNFTIDYGFLDEEQIKKVCQIHLPKKWCVEKVFNALNATINGKKANITGAFIANLADNIKEMSNDDKNWNIDDTVSLIEESYKGFYSSQIERERMKIGF